MLQEDMIIGRNMVDGLFLTYEETLCHRKRDFWEMPCALGADF